jgi:hypothetical protein
MFLGVQLLFERCLEEWFIGAQLLSLLQIVLKSLFGHLGFR